MRLPVAVVAVISFISLLPAAASAAPVATSQQQYQAYGAVFPDPLAVCQKNCDPNSRGRTNATQFIQYREFVDAITFMNKNEDWKRYMEVLPLDGKKGAGSGTKAGDDMWPGNNLPTLEWEPKKEYVSAGLPTTNQEQGTGKLKSDLIVVRVTDENVPDADKKRYALSLSIHGIERAGAEGGIRAMEEIVTAVSEKRGNASILPKEVRENAVSWRDVLANTIIYFTFPNPDGWRRGSIEDGGVFFQRYNGNGIDPNRDWPDIGYSFRKYSGGSEPETRAFQNYYRDVIARGGPFAAGDDLHGMPFADALSYTLLPHGRHDIDKDYRMREASKLINRAQYHATKWSPYIIENDEEAHCTVDVLGDACDRIYAQTWGSVYDTINYTTTGTLGDWFDSRIGLNADGIDNEMAFSHLDRNIAFEPHGEQLHVSGNKAIIYSHIDDMLRPPATDYATEGRNAYVANARLTREERVTQAGPPAGTTPQDDIADKPPTTGDPGSRSSSFEFKVERDFDTFNGGMRVDVRATNVQGIGSGVATLKVQCQGCDEHVGVEHADEWITIAEDYNQSLIYAQAGLTAAVNRPQAMTGAGEPIKWRALVSAPGGLPRFSVDFSSGPATSDGASAGDPPPVIRGYDVANTDFFADYNRHAAAEDDKFDPVDPAKVISGEQSLAGYKTLVLADEAMPGYVGAYKGEVRPSGPPTPDIGEDQFKSQKQTSPEPTHCEQNDVTTEYFPFTTGADDGNAEAKIRITWAFDSDYDLFVYKDLNANQKHDEGEPQAGAPSTGFLNTSETVTLVKPPPGSYLVAVVNCSAPPAGNPWKGTIEFTGYKADERASVFSAEQKDAWMAKLREWATAGGNLVLTDGALRALPELTDVPGDAVNEQTVYVGQTSFAVCEKFKDDKSCGGTKTTLEHPLARDVAQPAARFNSGMRRQTFEPTPLGFAIQNETGTDQAFARQYDVDLQKFVAAGGDPAGGSTDSGARNAKAIPTKVTLGRIPVGQGQVRVQGALLPQPSTAYDHPLGLEPYAVTYTGYILFCNLIDCTYQPKKRPALPNEPAPPGPVKKVPRPFDAKVQSPLLASNTLRGRRVRLRIRKKGIKRISHLVLEYRRTGRGTDRTYRSLRPKLDPTTKRVHFGKGRIGQTYLFRIRAIGKNGSETPWHHSRTVFPYDDRGKGRRYSKGWKRVKNQRSWLGGFTRSSQRGATLRFNTKGGGRVYLIGRTGPNGGTALFMRGTKKQIVSFKSEKRRNRQVVAVLNRTDKRVYKLRLRVLSGTVTIDGIAVRRR